MPIHHPLCSFLKDYTNTKHFSDYYHLKRNTKYQHLQVNWLLTFHFIQSGSTSITSFTETRNCSRKIKFLLEQLLTVQFIKVTQPQLYLPLWKCCRCNIHNEDFNHIWLCPAIRQNMRSLISESIAQLKLQLFIYTSKSVFADNINNLLNPSHTIWSLQAKPHDFSFIDLIKGIIPNILSSTLTTFTKSSSTTSSILSPFFDFVFTQAYNNI